MWFATQDGISRFDGKSFINLNSYLIDPRRKIIGTDVYDIKSDRSGDFLWVLSAYGGMNKVDLKTCNVSATYQVTHLVKPNLTLWYKCFYETNKYLIVGTNEGIVSLFNKATGKTDRSFSLTDRFNCAGQLEDIYVDSNNRVWFFISGNGILITDETCTTKQTLINDVKLHKNPFFFTDYAIHGNNIFVTTSSGLDMIDAEKMEPLYSANDKYINPGYFSGKELYSISVDGSLAIVSGKNSLSKLNLQNGKIEDIQLAGNYEDRTWLTLTNAVFLNGSTIWIGSQSGIGWIRNIHAPFIPFYSSFDGINVKIDHAITLNAITDSTILVCAIDGLYNLNHHTSVIKKILADDVFYSVFPVPGQQFIASGVSKGLQLLDKNLKPVSLLSGFPELSPIKNDLLMCAAHLGDSVIFMASQNKHGLYIWNTRTRKIDNINTRTNTISLQNDNINRLFIDSRKRLWIVCENAVSIYDYFSKQIQHLSLLDPESKVPLSINMDVCETNKGFWLTSYGTGIIQLTDDLKTKKIYTAKDGINNLGLYKIYGFNDSLIIASTNNGLTMLNTNSDIISNYFIEDGIQSNSFEEASGDKLGSYIFLGGIDGITRLDITKVNYKKPVPQLTFSTISLTSQNKTTDTLDININKIIIPSFISQLTINFSAINYLNPEQTKYSYKIVGIHNNWNVTNKPFIQSFRLSPGTYTLQVKAINQDGSASEIKELTLIFLPKWYQTWWFKALIALTMIAIGYSLYRMRINQLKKEEKIRNQLASDLHDDLGSTLNSVKVYSNLAMMEKENPSHLLRIKEGTQNAIAGVRDLIWVLDDKKDTIQDLFSRMNQFAAPLCEVNHIKFIEKIDEQLYYHKLGKEEKRNLYMILKESINNCIKYAGCQTIELLAETEAKKLKFTIRDNGNGFDKGKITAGNGLKNIATRAKGIAYDSSIISIPGSGTTIILEKI